MTSDEFAVEVRRLVNRVSHWAPSKWAAPSRVEATVSRADLMYAAVQHLADAGAVAEGRRTRQVPRLDNDLALPDQLGVVAADLVAAGADESVMAEAARLLNRTRLDL